MVNIALVSWALAAHGLMHMVITNAWKGDPYPIETPVLYMAWNSAMNTPETIRMLTDKCGDRYAQSSAQHLFRRLLLRDGRLCRPDLAGHHLFRAMGLHLAARNLHRVRAVAGRAVVRSHRSLPGARADHRRAAVFNLPSRSSGTRVACGHAMAFLLAVPRRGIGAVVSIRCRRRTLALLCRGGTRRADRSPVQPSRNSEMGWPTNIRCHVTRF